MRETRRGREGKTAGSRVSDYSKRYKEINKGMRGRRSLEGTKRMCEFGLW